MVQKFPLNMASIHVQNVMKSQKCSEAVSAEGNSTVSL